MSFYGFRLTAPKLKKIQPQGRMDIGVFLWCHEVITDQLKHLEIYYCDGNGHCLVPCELLQLKVPVNTIIVHVIENQTRRKL